MPGRLIPQNPCCFLVFILLLCSSAGGQERHKPQSSRTSTSSLEQVDEHAPATEGESLQLTPELLSQAMRKSADGYSPDETLIRDELRNAFLQTIAAELQIELSSRQRREVFLQLLQVRKAGKLRYRTSNRAPSINDGTYPVAEMAARVVMDRHQVSSDTILADPVLRRELQAEAALIRPKIDAYAVRRAVLGLRKQRRLQPELVLRVANWQRQISTMTLNELRTKLDEQAIPEQPGVYLFRDEQGYIYIGEAADIQRRLLEHLRGSDRAALAQYLDQATEDEVTLELHLFPNDSPAAQAAIRRAYESELIRSRSPRLNERP